MTAKAKHEPAPASPTPPAPRHPDRLAALASGFIGALALAVATYNVYLQRQQIRAQVWPRLEWHYSNIQGFSYLLHNSGVGPAEIRSVRISVDGKPVPDWSAIQQLILGKTSSMTYASMSGRVLGAGVEIKPLQLPDSKEAETFAEQANRIQIEVCYCSTLDECWLLAGNKRPESVGNCQQHHDDFSQ
jgi:hypothetical protein